MKHKITAAQFEILKKAGLESHTIKRQARPGIITDYKTIGSLDSARIPSSFPRAYYFQQLSYAYLAEANSMPVDTLELVYVSRENINRISLTTGKPMKDYPSEVHILRHVITNDDRDFIRSILTLVAESVQAWQEYPHLRHIIAQDMRRKAKPAPILFKD